MKKGESKSPEQVNADVQKLVMHGLKKSQEESEALMKSYVDEKVKPLEDKLSTILDLVNKIADQPVAPRVLLLALFLS
jgi:ferritin